MDILGLPPHAVLALAAAVTGPVACALSLWFAIRVDHRDRWRIPMMVAVTLATISVIGAYVTGERMLEADPGLAADPMVPAHREYAQRLLLPTVGFWLVGMTTGWLNPRTGMLKVALPLILTCFSVLVLALVLLSGDADARSLWDSVVGEF